jgi:uncharacterized protein YecT (DUF1311 family)
MRLVVMMLSVFTVWTDDFYDIQKCLNRAISNVEMTRCASLEYEYYDKELNVYYKRVMKRLIPEAKEQLRTAQRAWIKFRDENCEFWGYEMYGGTGVYIVQLGCLTEMTRKRTEELKDILRSSSLVR